ncbi:transcription initiation factor TFIID subunit 4-like [Cinclus cinclus]|uniref:transcription initiation factor TFIID subunit 4-like n=1 Tax=Cinclus cinclus TaxID=127875 RepID=UPI002E14EB3C
MDVPRLGNSREKPGKGRWQRRELCPYQPRVAAGQGGSALNKQEQELGRRWHRGGAGGAAGGPHLPHPGLGARLSPVGPGGSAWEGSGKAPEPSVAPGQEPRGGGSRAERFPGRGHRGDSQSPDPIPGSSTAPCYCPGVQHSPVSPSLSPSVSPRRSATSDPSPMSPPSQVGPSPAVSPEFPHPIPSTDTHPGEPDPKPLLPEQTAGPGQARLNIHDRELCQPWAGGPGWPWVALGGRHRRGPAVATPGARWPPDPVAAAPWHEGRAPGTEEFGLPKSMTVRDPLWGMLGIPEGLGEIRDPLWGGSGDPRRDWDLLGASRGVLRDGWGGIPEISARCCGTLGPGLRPGRRPDWD